MAFYYCLLIILLPNYFTLLACVPRSIQRLESSAHMESAHKSKEAKARGSTQGLWRAILGDLAAHAYLESCKSFADFNYIDFFISRKVND